MMAFNDIAILAEHDPSVLDRLEPDKSFLGILDIRGVPARWQRTDKQIAALRDARHKQQSQEQGVEQAGAVATAAGKAAPLLKMLAGGKDQGK